ncbi:MAG: ATP-binding protein, partial [Ginsengibacter sp.]
MLFTNQQRFGVEEGLPQSFISGITQDKDGFIWLGTLDGLSRYDGRQFNNFHYLANDNTGLSSNAIAYLLPQANNSISLLYEGNNNDEFDMRSFSVTRNNIPDLLRKIPGIIWKVISAGNTYNGKDWLFVKKGYKGIGWYNLATKKIRYANKANGMLQQDSIAALLQTSQGKVYLVSENGVQVSDTAKKNFRFIKFFTGIRSRGPQNKPLEYYGGSWVTELPGNQLAVTDYNRIVLLNLVTKTVKSYDLYDAERPELKEIPRLSQTDKNHQLYFEHGGRIFRLQKNGGLQLLWQNTFAPELKITACFIDRTEALWVSVNAQGLLKIDLRAMPFHSYQYQTNFFVDVLQQAGLPGTSFPSRWWFEKEAYFFRYAYDSKGNLFYSYNPLRQSGLFEWSHQQVRELPALKGENPVFTAIAIDAADGIWAYDMEKEGWYFWKTAQTHPEFFPLNSWTIRGVNLADARFFGENIWLSTYSQGLLKYEGTESLKQFIGKMANGNLLPELTEICADPYDKNKFWVGSRGGGLFLWDIVKGLQRVFSTEDGLPNNTVYCIVADKLGNLWCSTNKGIFRFNPVTHQVFGFEKPDGLPGNEFNRAHKFLFPDGRIAFGGLDGYTIFNPTDFDLKREVEAVPIQITSIQINNEVQDFTDKKGIVKESLSILSALDLPYYKNYLRFEFAAMQFNQPQKIRYRYQLKGADDKWIENGTNNIAAYSALRPGSYVLMINATDNNGLWSTSVKQLKITIQQPFWATWWAYVIYVLTGLALIRWYVVFKDNRNKMQQKLTFEHNDALRLREMDEVKDRFFSNVTHEFRTPLTMIITPLEKLIQDSSLSRSTADTLKTIQKSSHQLLRLINEFLDFSKLNDGQMKVRLSTGELCLFVTDCIQTFQAAAKEKNINLSLEVEGIEGLYLFDEDKWEKIITNLLSNALKFTPVNGQIQVLMSTINERIRFEVTDNGPGIMPAEQKKVFDRFYQADDSSIRNYQGTGIGLALVKELTELMKGSITLKSEPGKSTSFRVEIPVQKMPGITEAATSAMQAPAYTKKIVQEVADTLPLLMIVEDNKELRSFLAESMNANYRLLEAANGLEAWEMIL